MRPRRYVVRPARPGLLYVAEPEDDVLVIYLPEDLDEVTRRRYIRQALDDHDWYYRGLPALLPAPIVAAGHNVRRITRDHPTSTVVTAGVITVGIAATVLALAGDNAGSHQHPFPPGAAPGATAPPSHSAPAPSRTGPHPAPSLPPSITRSITPSKASNTTVPADNDAPVRHPPRSHPRPTPSPSSAPTEMPPSRNPVSCVARLDIRPLLDAGLLCRRA